MGIDWVCRKILQFRILLHCVYVHSKEVRNSGHIKGQISSNSLYEVLYNTPYVIMRSSITPLNFPWFMYYVERRTRSTRKTHR